jgi:hypothetical protein
VGVGVADVDRDRVLAVLDQQSGQAPVDFLKGLVPARLGQLTVAADQRRGQPVGVFVELLEPVGLGGR